MFYQEVSFRGIVECKTRSHFRALAVPVNTFEKVMCDLIVVGYGPCVMGNDVEGVLEASHTTNDTDVRALAVEHNKHQWFLKKG